MEIIPFAATWIGLEMIIFNFKYARQKKTNII